jgi:hypothetical protein
LARPQSLAVSSLGTRVLAAECGEEGGVAIDREEASDKGAGAGRRGQQKDGHSHFSKVCADISLPDCIPTQQRPSGVSDFAGVYLEHGLALAVLASNELQRQQRACRMAGIVLKACNILQPFHGTWGSGV